MAAEEQRYSKLWTMATRYLPTGNIGTDPAAPLSKLNYMQNLQRHGFTNPDEKVSGEV